MTKRAKSLTKRKSKHQPARKAKTPRAQARKKSSPARKSVTRKPADLDPLDALVDAAAAALALPLEPAWRGSVKSYLGLILQFADTFAEFELPDEAEPAPVFRA